MNPSLLPPIDNKSKLKANSKSTTNYNNDPLLNNPTSNNTNPSNSILPKIDNKKLPNKIISKVRVIPTIPLAAGIPIYEVFKKLEIENLLSREDKLLLNEIMNYPQEREAILKELQRLELRPSAKLSLKIVKDIIAKYKMRNVSRNSHTRKDSSAQNVFSAAAGASNQNEEEIDDIPIPDTQSTIIQVVGASPVYSNPTNFDVCAKISTRLQDFVSKYGIEKAKTTQFAVIVGSGSFNPLTRMHLRTFYIAKQYIETHSNIIILGSLLSPAHPTTVRQRFRTFPSEIIPSPHRLAIAQLAVRDSIWLSIDPWEITRRCAMDYLSLLEHVGNMTRTQFPDFQIKPIYLCKPNAVPLISLTAIKQQNFGCVCVCRPLECDHLLATLSTEMKSAMFIAEDNAIVDTSIDTVSSRKVRLKLKKEERIEHLVGEVIADYFRVNHISRKMNGIEKWTPAERHLPKLLSGGGSPSKGNKLPPVGDQKNGT